jgi:hypothetical protein
VLQTGMPVASPVDHAKAHMTGSADGGELFLQAGQAQPLAPLSACHPPLRAWLVRHRLRPSALNTATGTKERR